MLPTSRDPVLRPRELVAELFARTLDGDTVAEDDLEALAQHDVRADVALDAIALVAVESCVWTDPGGRDVAPVPAGLLERALAAIDAVHDDRDRTAATGRSRRSRRPEERRPRGGPPRGLGAEVERLYRSRRGPGTMDR